ncbi:MAG: NnrS family protein, partial [Thiogranum sp.]
PPRLMPWFLLLLLVAALVRVVLPPLLPDFYDRWIELSQLLWIIAFAGFVALYTPILTRASRP